MVSALNVVGSEASFWGRLVSLCSKCSAKFCCWVVSYSLGLLVPLRRGEPTYRVFSISTSSPTAPSRSHESCRINSARMSCRELCREANGERCGEGWREKWGDKYGELCVVNRSVFGSLTGEIVTIWPCCTRSAGTSTSSTSVTSKSRLTGVCSGSGTLGSSLSKWYGFERSSMYG